MRKFLLMACALFGFMACTQEAIDEQSAIRVDAPETIKVGFEDDETRIQLNEAQKTVWTKDDLVSVFYRSDANQKWQYQGETGERVGNLKRVEDATATTQTTKTVVVYPYSKNYWLNTDNYAIDATLPATQYYAAGSYGVGSNLMVSQSEFTQFSLKSVCGWLKLQLTGNGEVVKSIKFSGNNGEQVAGLIYVDTETAKATLASEMGGSDDNNAGGNLIFDDTILTEVVLDCGEGVELGAETTSFYISLPPQTFANGFTVEIEDNSGYVMTQSTSKQFIVERNTIQPMSVVKFVNPNRPTQPTPANNEIWYTNGSTTEATTPYATDVFGANIVSNTYDAAKECWVIKFDGDVTTIGRLAFADCSSLTDITIPDSVTEIGYCAFYGCSSLTSVTIGDSVTTIGDYAFNYCDSLTCVTIGDSVTTIGDYAFYDCIDLTSVTIGNSVTTIGHAAFYWCYSLTSVTIPDSVTTIGSLAFCGCRSLTSVTIPDSVTTIGYRAFEYCSSLTSVTIPDSVTTIGEDAFADCSGLREFNGKFASEDGRCLIIDGVLNYFAPVGLTEYTIPNSVTTIGDCAFYGCESLTSVTIPDSVTSIGDYAFTYCRSLTSVTIGDSVTTIGEDAFFQCSSLREFNGKFASEDSRCLIIDGTLNSFARAGLTEYTIPDSVTSIGYAAFVDCNSLTSVTIPDSVTSIGDYAFEGCSSLTSVTIPDSVTSIGDYAFEGCSSLTNVTIGDSVTTIGDYAFEGCSSLTNVTIGDSVTTIGYAAFVDCNSLTSVTIPDSVTTIGFDAFYKCSSLTSVTIGDSVTEIGYCAFYGCSSLTSVTIPDSVTTIGNYAFAYCSSLTSVTIGDSVTTIGSGAFSGCSSLTSVTIPDSVTTIGGFAFYSCSSLTSVYCKATTPPSLDGTYVFDNNGSGRKIYVPAGSVNAYKSAAYWNEYRSAIVGYYF